MKCIVIDDEHLACKGMEMLIQQIPALQYCGSFSNVIDADVYIRTNPVDLIFLDIQMPVMTGIEYLKSIENACQFILTTAYSQYALQGFDLNVTDYLVKPIRFERFYKAVNKALEKNIQRKNISIDSTAVQVGNDYVFVRSDRKFIKVDFNSISYIEGCKDYVALYTPEKIMCALNLRNILTHLPAHMFMRVNKSFIINLSKIQYMDNDYVWIDKKQIPVGEGFKNQLLEHIKAKGVISRY